LMLPVVVVALVVFTAATALVISMANLFYRDVKYLFEIVIAVWMFATSVVYPIGRVGGKLGAVLALNPMTHLIDAFRAVLLDERMPGMAFGVTFAAAAVMLAGAWVMFHLAESDFAENL
jgi:homopolymeric O-antigen transport system permease protein